MTTLHPKCGSQKPVTQKQKRIFYGRNEFLSDYPKDFEINSYRLLINLSGRYSLPASMELNVSVKNLSDETYKEKLGDNVFGRIMQARIAALLQYRQARCPADGALT